MTDSTSANNSASVFQDNSASINRISVKIPPFWPNDPEIWFLQVENQFTLANITSDATKFNYIVANLETVYISEVRDIIVSPPTTERYVKLKLEIIKRLSASQQQKIKRLLEHEELGDRRPSQFLRHLQSLAGKTVSDNIVRSLWLGRLPSSTHAILATQAKASLDAVAELADTSSEAIAPSVHISEAFNARESTIDKLTAELAEMKIQLASLSQAQAQTKIYRCGIRSKPKVSPPLRNRL
ncbi:uncharacterized protein LOC114326886 [Diabrotica virgifera virgifera]|uniref:Uncharacterized protein LOC114326886 n=1 Tax=Diabrotica virgifera virgifera TaxID=50390 RepID=A0A6P7F8M1_DIAVI|nr:uncharacterized protein LOC114326886 [Diabrotica virgifera virgifera]